MKKSKGISQEEFNNILVDILMYETGESLLFIPGAYEIFSEYFKIEVIGIWEAENETD